MSRSILRPLLLAPDYQLDQNERTQAPSKRLYWWGSPQGCPLSPGVTAPGHTL